MCTIWECQEIQCWQLWCLSSCTQIVYIPLIHCNTEHFNLSMTIFFWKSIKFQIFTNIPINTTYLSGRRPFFKFRYLFSWSRNFKFLWNLNVHYHSHKIQPLDTIKWRVQIMTILICNFVHPLSFFLSFFLLGPNILLTNFVWNYPHLCSSLRWNVLTKCDTNKSSHNILGHFGGQMSEQQRLHCYWIHLFRKCGTEWINKWYFLGHFFNL